MIKNLLNRRRFNATAIALFAAALTPLHAADFTEWKFRQEIAVGSAGLTSLTLAPETLDAARLDRGDLRLVDPTGREIAFALHRSDDFDPPPKPSGVRSFHTTLRESSSEIVIECDPANVSYLLGTVTLETPAREFIKRAKVEYSSDNNSWSTAEEGVPIFRQSGAEQLNIRSIRAPFVRVTLDDSRSKPVPFVGAKFTRAIWGSSSTLYFPFPIGVRILRREEFMDETVFTLELASAKLPLSWISFSTPERMFTRRVTVGIREVQESGAVERTFASGHIYNIIDSGPAPKAAPMSGVELGEENYTKRLGVALDFTPPSRELIVHVANGDSPPLALTDIKITHHGVKLFFDASAAGSYILFCGHPQIKGPHYDISQNRPKVAEDTPGVRIGPLTPNPGYRPPETLPGTAILGAAIDPAPWRCRKTVQVSAPGVQQLELDLDVLVRAQAGFGDLRLVQDGAQVPYLLERPALSRSIALTPKPANDPKRTGTSRWEIALPRAGLPLTRLTLTSPTALFQRQLHVFETIVDDRGNRHDRTLAIGEWSHTPDNTRPLTLPLNSPPVTATLFVETDNGDNPPIALGAVTAAHAVARLLFKTEADAVALYYGNAQVGAPRYDLALVAGQILAAPKTIATLGAEEKARPDGWAQGALAGAKGGVLFWAVLALVVIVLLVVVAKLLPKPPAPSV
jgi:hypothetical protein